jgi:hypothetical protein
LRAFSFLETIMTQPLDAQDAAILAARQTLRNKIQGPRIGDFVCMKDRTLRRFTYDWGDAIQVTSTLPGSQRFYLHTNGQLDYSGGLDQAIPKIRLKPADKTQPGSAWFFRHDQHGAHNGIDVTLPCRVFEEL